MNQETEPAYIEKIRDVKERFADDLSRTPNFTGLGIGFKKVDGNRNLLIVVNLTKELTDDQIQTAPMEIEGVHIEYRVSGEVKKIP